MSHSRNHRTRTSRSTAPTILKHMATPSEKLALAEAEISRLREENADLTYDRDSAAAHAIFAQDMFQAAQNRLNAKVKKKDGEGRRMRTTSQILTSAAGLAEWDEEKKRRAEKKSKDEAAASRKMAAEAATKARREVVGNTQVFTGSLGGKKKEEVEDIAIALGLPVSGTKDTLVQRISAHLGSHPELKDNDRFVGLFMSLARGSKRTAHTAGLDTLPAAPTSSSSVPGQTPRRRRIDENTPPPAPSTPTRTLTCSSVFGFYQGPQLPRWNPLPDLHTPTPLHAPLSPTAGPSRTDGIEPPIWH